jgi:hypothetical protein
MSFILEEDEVFKFFMAGECVDIGPSAITPICKPEKI